MGDINTETMNQEHKPFLKHPVNVFVEQCSFTSLKLAGYLAVMNKLTDNIASQCCLDIGQGRQGWHCCDR